MHSSGFAQKASKECGAQYLRLTSCFKTPPNVSSSSNTAYHGPLPGTTWRSSYSLILIQYVSACFSSLTTPISGSSNANGNWYETRYDRLSIFTAIKPPRIQLEKLYPSYTTVPSTTPT